MTLRYSHFGDSPWCEFGVSVVPSGAFDTSIWSPVCPIPLGALIDGVIPIGRYAIHDILWTHDPFGGHVEERRNFKVQAKAYSESEDYDRYGSTRDAFTWLLTGTTGHFQPGREKSCSHLASFGDVTPFEDGGVAVLEPTGSYVYTDVWGVRHYPERVRPGYGSGNNLYNLPLVGFTRQGSGLPLQSELGSRQFNGVIDDDSMEAWQSSFEGYVHMSGNNFSWTYTGLDWTLNKDASQLLVKFRCTWRFWPWWLGQYYPAGSCVTVVTDHRFLFQYSFLGQQQAARRFWTDGVLFGPDASCPIHVNSSWSYTGVSVDNPWANPPGSPDGYPTPGVTVTLSTGDVSAADAVFPFTLAKKSLSVDLALKPSRWGTPYLDRYLSDTEGLRNSFVGTARAYASDIRASAYLSAAKALDQLSGQLAANNYEQLSELRGLSESLPDLEPLAKAFRYARQRDPRSLAELADFITSTRLAYSFDWKSTLDFFREGLNTMLSYTWHPFVVGRGRFDYDFDEGVFGGITHLTAHTTLAINPSVVLSGLLADLDRLGVLPTPSRVWDTAPFSFVVDWRYRIGDRIQRMDSFIRSLPLDIRFVTNTFLISKEYSSGEIQAISRLFRCGGVNTSSSTPLGVRWYVREVSRYVPPPRASRFDFGAPDRVPDGTLVGALLYQLAP